MNGLTYKQWNEAIRDILNKYPKLVTELKLPNTVMLQFRRNESKKLTIDTFSKFVEGLGLSFEIIVKDKEGNIVDTDTLKKIASNKVEKKKNETLATIAGVSTTKKNEIPDNIDDANTMPDADDAMPASGEVKIGENNIPLQNESGEALAASPEIEVDLDAIFGK